MAAERVNVPPTLPGTGAQQALLRGIINAYSADERVLAVGVLGSLGRGTWDEWSDLDLDVVVGNEMVLDASSEARALCDVLGESEALVVPSRPGEGDVLLPSLEQFSIRYHTLGTTNAHIIDDLKIVGGRLDRADVVAAGVVHSLPVRVPELVASEALRFALSVDTAVRRGNVWQALRVLDELRWRLLELFAISLGQPRPAHAVDALAGQELRDKLGGLLAQADLASIAQALANALDLITNDELTGGRFALTRSAHSAGSPPTAARWWAMSIRPGSARSGLPEQVHRWLQFAEELINQPMQICLDMVVEVLAILFDYGVAPSAKTCETQKFSRRAGEAPAFGRDTG